MAGIPDGARLLSIADVEVPELQLDELPEDPLDTDLVDEHGDAAADEATGQDPDL